MKGTPSYSLRENLKENQICPTSSFYRFLSFQGVSLLGMSVRPSVPSAFTIQEMSNSTRRTSDWALEFYKKRLGQKDERTKKTKINEAFLLPKNESYKILYILSVDSNYHYIKLYVNNNITLMLRLFRASRSHRRGGT